MQTPYQQLVAPQPIYAVAVPAAAAPASACCPCCVEPACCSRVGSCPCFCSGYTASFSLALCCQWLSLPMLATALSLDMFDLSVWWNEASFTLWGVCGLGNYSDPDNEYYDYECDNYDDDMLSMMFGTQVTLFQTMRVLAVVSTALTLLTGILGAIRLARQQRSKPISKTLSSTTAISGGLALATAAMSFGFTFPLNSTLQSNLQDAVYNSDDQDIDLTTSFGAGWVMMIVGVGLLFVGTVMHSITQCCFSRSMASAEAEVCEQPGLYATAGYPAAASASVFSHPQPLTHAVPAPAVYYPTATAVHYPPPQYVHPMGHSHIYQ